MKKLMIAALFAVVSFGATASDVRISTGSKSGSYFKYGNAMGRYMGQLGYKSEVLKSKGAVQNLERLAAGEADIGFTQGDVLNSFLKKTSADLEIVAVLGQECVFIAVNPNGRVTNEDDLQTKNEEKPHTIAVGRKGSGSQVSFDYMTQLEDGYKASSPQYKGGVRALAQVAAGKLDAVMWVMDPRAINSKMNQTVHNNENLEFIDVDDSDLNDKLPNGEPVYTFEDVDTYSGMGGGIDTICTPLLVVANSEADEELLEDLATVMMNNSASITQR